MIPRLLATVLAALALLVLGALPAAAHVRVTSEAAEQGGYAKTTFRVPTESDTASTVAIQVFLPADAPLAFAAVEPHPGWTPTVHERSLPTPLQTDDGPVSEVVSDVVWTADSPRTGIAPGQFDEFSLYVGALPRVDELSFPTTQSYSDGQVVTWNQASAPGAPEPEHPAPVLHLSAPGSASSEKPDSSAGGASPAVSATPLDPEPTDGPALTVAIVALVVALGAAVALAVALVRGRRA